MLRHIGDIEYDPEAWDDRGPLYEINEVVFPHLPHFYVFKITYEALVSWISHQKEASEPVEGTNPLLPHLYETGSPKRSFYSD